MKKIIIFILLIFGILTAVEKEHTSKTKLLKSSANSFQGYRLRTLLITLKNHTTDEIESDKIKQLIINIIDHEYQQIFLNYLSYIFKKNKLDLIKLKNEENSNNTEEIRNISTFINHIRDLRIKISEKDLLNQPD
ncbi:MAG: hypothetical protein P4L22_02600 [Candidatus Babeliales bacterium]|nr:hypothetical protein [Candidatus Babeliales bacterium]